MLALQKKKWWLVVFVIALIVLSNTLIYRLDFMQPLPNEIALGSLIDLMIVIPLIIYFFLMRKKYSLKYMLPMALVGYGAALLIIPYGHLESYSFVKYIVLAGEGAFLFVEVYVIFKLIRHLPSIISHIRMTKLQVPFFQNNLEQSFSKQLKPSRLLDIISSEISMFYYSFFSWKTKRVVFNSNQQVFTLHEKTSVIALYIMLLHALVIESVGLHFLFHSWNAIFAYILLFLNIYALIYFIGEIQAIRLNPVVITNNYLYLQVGLGKRLTVPFESIKSIHPYDGPEKLSSKESKTVFDAVLPDLTKEKPAFEIEFYKPIEAKYMYGFKNKVSKVHIRPDDATGFYHAIIEKMK
ncbi:hypothetical protein [Metabacillus litoralis]|uniref:hypothetical protein n=1 Tax=Metabacillus litoralis TaxID=152268 RepID=UPI001CFCAB0D|nr:hypothetical protein [Metabacillus litoralis]